MTDPITRPLGRTRREVTTLGLGGQASIQWPNENSDPVGIIEKAYRIGINYMDTSNIYGPSQKHFGQAFKRLGLSPSESNYDPNARKKIFLATKTHIRTARQPEGENFRSNYSEGMLDDFEVSTSVDDVRRSLSLMFGDGKGNYPEGAYLDSVQFHNLNTMDEIDMLYEGLDNPSPDRPWMGSLAAMLDLREGTNKTGCNPKNEKLIKHIGMSGHWNSAALMYAIRRDIKKIIDTLLVAINPSDSQYMPHRYNAIETAACAGMGIIGMKVFADAAYYHKKPIFSGNPEDVYHQIGSKEMPSNDLIAYALSVEGISTVITGIGHVDDDSQKCQLEQNFASAQISTPLKDDEMKQIEKMVVDAGKSNANSYFQRTAIGLSGPKNLGVELDSAMHVMNHHAIRVSWDTAYAAASPILRYEVFCDDNIVGNVEHSPQISEKRFCFTHVLNDDQKGSTLIYKVRTVDADNNIKDSASISIKFH